MLSYFILTTLQHRYYYSSSSMSATHRGNCQRKRVEMSDKGTSPCKGTTMSHFQPALLVGGSWVHWSRKQDRDRHHQDPLCSHFAGSRGKTRIRAFKWFYHAYISGIRKPSKSNCLIPSQAKLSFYYTTGGLQKDTRGVFWIYINLSWSVRLEIWLH